jgi:hypothetical protein
VHRIQHRADAYRSRWCERGSSSQTALTSEGDVFKLRTYVVCAI